MIINNRIIPILDPHLLESADKNILNQGDYQ